jgi:ABC-type sugar transport system substrate-binding protein
VTAGTTEAQILYNSGARKWVAMTGAQGNSVATDRLKGMQNFVAQHPDVTVLKTQFGNEARSSGQTTMENFLSALPGPGFDGVWSFNDEGALGAIQALSNANDLSKVKVAMIDGTPDGLTAVANGQAIVTVSGGTACGAFSLVELFDFLNGHPPNNRLYLQPLIPVTPSNVQAYETQVINGAANYDFKAISQVYNPSASTADYKITLKP